MGLLYVVMPVLKAFLPCNALAKGAAFDARRDEEERYKTS